MDTRKLGTFLAVAILVVIVVVYVKQQKKTLTRSQPKTEAPRVAAKPPPPPPRPKPKPVAVTKPAPAPKPVAATKPKPVRTVAMVTRQPISEELSAFDKDVEEAIKKGVEFLWAQQREDGSWPPYGEPKNAQGQTNQNYQEVGPTALAAYALLASGESVKDPRMVKALEWLSGTNASTAERVLPGLRKSDRTYSVALRCSVWMEADKQDPGKYHARLIADARQIVNSTSQGAYGYGALGRPEPKVNWDNSNSQYGLLGAWAAAEGNVEIPGAYWAVVTRHWESCQKADGGWSYRVTDKNPAHGDSKATMTVAGLASLFVCMDYGRMSTDWTVCREVKNKRIDAGLEWLDKNFEQALTGQQWSHYFLYGLERVGLASGHKYFGKKDWYKVGAEQLIRNKAGNWGGVPNTAFAVLFLIRGRQAVLVNRLQYEGDWNNRPRAAAWLVRWLGRTFERPLAWQIIDADTNVEEWHDAPILLVTGFREPKFTPEQIDRMRRFILQGGLVLSVAECRGVLFNKAMRDLYPKLFPGRSLEPVPRDHDLYSNKVHFPLGERCKFHVLSNGVRPLVLHVEDDLTLLWQTRNIGTGKWAFEMAANAIKYATGSISALRSRGITHWPAPKPFQPARTIQVVRLAHKANAEAEPLAWERMTTLIGMETQTKLDVAGPSNFASLAGSKAQVAVLSGTDKLELAPDDKAALAAFVEGGGTLIVDAIGGAKPFADSARDLLEELYGRSALRTLPEDSPVYQMTNLKIDRFAYRPRTQVRLNHLKHPQVQVIEVKGRPAVYFSAEDLTAGLVGYGSYTVDGYEPKTAYEIVRNIILYAWQQAA